MTHNRQAVSRDLLNLKPYKMVNINIVKARCEKCYKERYKFPYPEREFRHKNLRYDEEVGKLKCENCGEYTSYIDDEDFREQKYGVERKTKKEYIIRKEGFNFKIREIQKNTKMGKKYIQIEKTPEIERKITALKDFMNEKAESKTAEKCIDHMYRTIFKDD